MPRAPNNSAAKKGTLILAVCMASALFLHKIKSARQPWLRVNSRLFRVLFAELSHGENGKLESKMNQLTLAAQRALSLMDLTTLNDDDTDDKVIALCRQAHTSVGETAAVCTYPRFIPLARQTLNVQGSTAVRIATVTNFPHGNDSLDIALTEIRAAIAYGADEVDIVFPYRALIAGNEQIGLKMVKQSSELCHASQVLLKVIIESGELRRADLIRQASQIAIAGGADFIKTSTGKVPVNTTLESASIMLNVIAEEGVGDCVGFKAAGGVRTAEAAAAYLALADEIMGEGWINPRHFRFGASSLLDSLLMVLRQEAPPAKNGY